MKMKKNYKIEIRCDYCGRIILRYVNSLKRSKRHFCSHKCKGHWQSINYNGEYSAIYKNTKVQRKCDYCNKIVLIFNCRKDNNHIFCNRKCYEKWSKLNFKGVNNPNYKDDRIIVECAYCKKTLLRRTAHTRKVKNSFCNSQCKGKWMSIHLREEKSHFYRNAKQKIYCTFCNKEILRKKSQIKRTKNHFCNKECMKSYQINNSYQKIKLVCDYCKNVFLRKENHIKKFQNKYFCSVDCSNKSLTGRNNPNYNRIEVKCANCGNIILKKKHIDFNNKRYFCNSKCLGEFRKGANNFQYDGGRIAVPCNFCKKIIFKNKEDLHSHKNHFCNNKCKNNFQKGENHFNWLDGSSFLPYSQEFNQKLKNFIKQRDQYKCQNPDCGVPEKECTYFDVHHIDYNKINSDPINLIALCRSCHSKTNSNRKYWQSFYENIQIKRKVHMLERNIEQNI